MADFPPSATTIQAERVRTAQPRFPPPPAVKARDPGVFIRAHALDEWDEPEDRSRSIAGARSPGYTSRRIRNDSTIRPSPV